MHVNPTIIPAPGTSPKPSDLFREWHPDLFSDTIRSDVEVLPKSIFEYHLETLTNRKDELEFEEFARRLVELEICPNIKPQTGPTGGGDSKTDASSYPVASELALRRYWWGTDPVSGDFAFAFSCKKKWNSKAKTDVESIAQADRKYKTVYFVTNQFVPDKKRSETEKELSEKYGFEVHILDRTWIVTRIIDHKQEKLAIETLGIQVTHERKDSIGPRDLERKIEYEALIQKLRSGSYGGNDYALAQDYQTCAKLARSLEKPRHEVDSLFAKARNIAAQINYPRLGLRCGYDHAWTVFWWYDDAEALEHIYSEIENFITDTNEAQDCELLSNLWMLLRNAVLHRLLQAEKAKLELRLQVLKKELNRLMSDGTRPNNALHAESILLWMDLMYFHSDPDRANAALKGLRSCFKRSVGLGMYPLTGFIENLQKVGEFIGNLPEYASLFEDVTKLVKHRYGETEEGKMYLERGMQLLNAKADPKQLLLYFGRARLRLTKEETVEEGATATRGCCHAYRRMGLLWAARNEGLIAAHYAFRRVDTAFNTPKVAFGAALQMAWIELTLGRVLGFLSWYKLACFVCESMRSTGITIDSYEKELFDQQMIFGCLLLNLPSEDIKELESLQDSLNAERLVMAKQALLFRLGKMKEIMSSVPDNFGDEEAVKMHLENWKTQPAAKQLLYKIKGEALEFVILETRLWGVTYRFKARNSFGLLAFAENMLGILEAVLALAKWENLAFIIDSFEIVLDFSDEGKNPPTIELRCDGARLLWTKEMLHWMNSNAKETSDFLTKLLFAILLHITVDPIDEIRAEFDRWKDEETFNRAFTCSPISIILQDLIGKDAYDLHYWQKSASA